MERLCTPTRHWTLTAAMIVALLTGGGQVLCLPSTGAAALEPGYLGGGCAGEACAPGSSEFRTGLQPPERDCTDLFLTNLLTLRSTRSDVAVTSSPGPLVFTLAAQRPAVPTRPGLLPPTHPPHLADAEQARSLRATVLLI